VVDACVGRLGCRGRGNPAVPSDPANTVAVGGLSSDQVALQVECRTDGSVAQCPGNGPTPVFYEARQAVIGLTDNVNPVFVSGPDGPLVDSVCSRGPRSTGRLPRRRERLGLGGASRGMVGTGDPVVNR